MWTCPGWVGRRRRTDWSLHPGHRSQQVLEIVVVPADAAAEDDRVALGDQGVVLAPGQEEVGSQPPAPGQPQMRIEIVGAAEVVSLQRHP